MTTQNTKPTQVPQPIDLEALEGFTPGPWHAQQSDHSPRLLIKPIPGQVIAECDLVPNMEANARLIAAAPQMHAELKAAREREARLVEALAKFRAAAMDTPALDDSPEWTELIEMADKP